MATTKDHPRGHARQPTVPQIPADDLPPTPDSLYADATHHLTSSNPHAALPLATQLHTTLLRASAPPDALVPALQLLGEICVETGDVDAARAWFAHAVELDPTGKIPGGMYGIGTADRFLWLAQLCDEGGAASVAWFDRGIEVLRREIKVLESSFSTFDDDSPDADQEDAAFAWNLAGRARKLVAALCATVEVYMTDLSWDPHAEANCELRIAAALAARDPPLPEALQTLASVRLSQSRVREARQALSESLEAWRRGGDAGDDADDADEANDDKPDFAARVSLARLLMEASMCRAARAVLDDLVREDDQSVEAWYLGGWCRCLLARMTADGQAADDIDKNEGEEEETDAPSPKALRRESRRWLRACLALCDKLEYEDERLREHASELVEELDGALGDEDKEEDDDSVEEGEIREA